MGIGGCGLPSWAPWPFGQVWTGHVQRRQSRGPSSLRRVKCQPSGNIPQVLNPEQGQDEDDNVVVTDDSEKQPENEEVLAIKRQGRVGRHVVSNGQLPHIGHPQDMSEDSEDNKNSESERESDEEESDEEDRDEDVDPGFREQLMAVLQAGKALVSRSRAGPLLRRLPACTCGGPGCSLGACPSGWSGRR